MESPDPWDLAESTGFPTDEELRYRGEDPEIENGCPLCGKSLDDEPYEWDEENKIMVHSKCLKEAREYLASIASDIKRIDKSKCEWSINPESHCQTMCKSDYQEDYKKCADFWLLPRKIL